MYGLGNLRITVCNICFPKTGLPPTRYRIRYAFHSGAHRGDLDRKQSFLSDDIEVSELAKEEFPYSMSFYCGQVRDNADLPRGRFL